MFAGHSFLRTFRISYENVWMHLQQESLLDWIVRGGMRMNMILNEISHRNNCDDFRYDVIIVDAGTNDLDTDGATVSHVSMMQECLVDTIKTLNPNSVIVLMPILPRLKTRSQKTVCEFNAEAAEFNRQRHMQFKNDPRVLTWDHSRRFSIKHIQNDYHGVHLTPKSFRRYAFSLRFASMAGIKLLEKGKLAIDNGKLKLQLRNKLRHQKETVEHKRQRRQAQRKRRAERKANGTYFIAVTIYVLIYTNSTH